MTKNELSNNDLSDRVTTRVKEISTQIKEYQSKGLRLFVSSSFQTQSIPLLHMLSEIDRTIPVFFLNTGYLFPETLTFKDTISELLNLNVVDVQSQTPKNLQRDGNGRLLFTSNPDLCCHINKVEPLIPVMESYDIWINGVRASQSKTRSAFSVEEPTEQRATRYHPILEWSDDDIEEYRRHYNLPEHPLQQSGYVSIGCEPCTQIVKISDNDGERSGRWSGMKKTECGLHTRLVSTEK